MQTPGFELTAKQAEANELLASEATHVMLEGGSRSGKTFLAVRAICLRALKAPRSRHLITRFRFNACKQSVGLETLPAVMRLCFPGVQWKMDKSDWYVTLGDGSEIWLGGLDDKERTEKILGKEYATILANECSQIPWASINIARTRLAQNVSYTIDGKAFRLPLRMFYDCNPPQKTHWTYQVFHLKRDPDTKKALPQPQRYAAIRINPDDNRANVPAEYFDDLQSLPERLKRRFLRGEYADATENALFTSEIFDRWRVTRGELPDWQRIVIGVDPSGSGDIDNADNDSIGIVVGALGTDGNAYLLEDLTLKAGPKTWGNIVASAFDRLGADRVVGEQNFGGAMVEFVIRTARPGTPYRAVTATRGKHVRAEPVSALCEQGRVRIVGYMPDLEDELCGFTVNGYTGSGSPNRADAAVWVVSELFPGIVAPRKEPKKVAAPREYVAHGEGGWLAA